MHGKEESRAKGVMVGLSAYNSDFPSVYGVFIENEDSNRQS